MMMNMITAMIAMIRMNATTTPTMSRTETGVATAHNSFSITVSK